MAATFWKGRGISKGYCATQLYCVIAMIMGCCVTHLNCVVSMTTVVFDPVRLDRVLALVNAVRLAYNTGFNI